ncbi:MAG: hypothetical protein JRJ04_05750 [Deltaproteobacteria bacterium]|nr:hypothetical protein [Deltaproteobacteria bacterium]
MKRLLLKFTILAAVLLILPLLGVLLAGYPFGRYLEFPPESRYVVHTPFSWIVFIVYSAIILAAVLPLLIGGLKAGGSGRVATMPGRCPFPWWGWLGIVLGVIAWVLAWTRFPWFARFQPHTFTPLWVSLILVINALSYRQKGRCLMFDRTGFFLILFPLSALFWWFFEYLNRFVQNWYYVGPTFGAWEYFWYATLPFSTVLPAVLSVQYWMSEFGWIKSRFHNLYPIRPSHPKKLAAATLFLSAAGLAGLAVWPNFTFSLLWISPLLILLSLQTLFNERHILSDLTRGDWQTVISAALAALFCGLFWETWNFYSLAKWKYSIPFVHRFQVFEMPILGYAGYLPFGLECLAMGRLLESLPIFTRTA